MGNELNQVLVAYVEPDPNNPSVNRLAVKVRDWAMAHELDDARPYILCKVFHFQGGAGGANAITFNGIDVLSIASVPGAIDKLRVGEVQLAGQGSPSSGHKSFFHANGHIVNGGTQELRISVPSKAAQSVLHGARLYAYDYDASDYDDLEAEAMALTAADGTE